MVIIKMKEKHVKLPKCYMLYYLYKQDMNVTTGSGTGVVAARVCINLTIYLKNYSERLVKH